MRSSVLKVFWALLFFAVFNSTAFATNRSLEVMINNTGVKFYTYPVIVSNKLLIPVRDMFEFFGFEVNWDSKLNTAVCVKNSNSVSLNVPDGIVRVNNKDVKTGSPLTIMGGRIFVQPVIMELCLGVKINWNEKEKTVYIWNDTGDDIEISGEGNIVAVGKNIIINMVG